MAIAKTMSPIGAISGSIGSLVAVNTKAGLVLRPRPIKTNPRTAPQQRARSMPGAIAAAWANLTEQQRNSWRNAARNAPLANRLGVSRNLTGWQLYTYVAMLVYHGSVPANLTPPAALWNYPAQWVSPILTSSGLLSVTARGPLPAPATVTGYAYLDFACYATQQSAFRPRRALGTQTLTYAAQAWTSELATYYHTIPTGTPYALGIRTQITNALPSEILWAAGTVDGFPYTVDDFERGAVQWYTGDTAYYSISTAQAYDGTRSLKCETTSGGTYTVRRLLSTNGLPNYSTRGLRVTARMYLDTNTYSVGLIATGTADTDVLAVVIDEARTKLKIYRRLASAGSYLATSGAITVPTGEWVKVSFHRNASNLITVKCWKADGTLLATVTATDSNFYPSACTGNLIAAALNTTTTVYWDAIQIDQETA